MIASLWRLSWAERSELAVFALLIPAITVALRTIGFRRTQRALAALSRQPRTHASSGRRETSVTAFRRARRYAPYRGNCLPQSLALWWRLRQQGVDAEFCLGARLDNGALASHAWVEFDGETLNDSPLVREQFAAFDGSIRLPRLAPPLPSASQAPSASDTP